MQAMALCARGAWQAMSLWRGGCAEVGRRLSAGAAGGASGRGYRSGGVASVASARASRPAAGVCSVSAILRMTARLGLRLPCSIPPM